MADLDDFGIASISTALTKKLTVKNSLQETDAVLTSVGAFSTAFAYGEEWMFDGEGAGDIPADFALAGVGPTISGLTGGVQIIDKAGESQSVGSANGWSASGEHAPAAE